MANRKSNFTAAAESTLSAGLSVGATTINVTDTSAFPAVPFYATIDPGDDAKRETVYVDSAVSGTTFTLSAGSSRGQAGTTDVAHDNGARIAHVVSAAAFNDLHDRVTQHDHSGGDEGAAVATGDLSGHDKAAHDALNIDADTLDGVEAAAFALADGTRTWEVDGYDTEASVSTSLTFATEVTVTLTIPAGWGGYKIIAHGAVILGASTSGEARLEIDGDTGLVVRLTNDAVLSHRRTGLTTTGPIACHIQVQDDNSPQTGTAWLYARAVRTS